MILGLVMANGEIEVNDANAIMRGHFTAATGSFSGKFSATNIDAVNNINIRDGAVSSYYSFSRNGATGKNTFTVPARTNNDLLRVHFPVKIYHRPQVFVKEVQDDGFTIIGNDQNHQAGQKLVITNAGINAPDGSNSLQIAGWQKESYGRLTYTERVDPQTNTAEFYPSHSGPIMITFAMVLDVVDTRYSTKVEFWPIDPATGAKIGLGECSVTGNIVAEYRIR